jgi:hypothetical protein
MEEVVGVQEGQVLVACLLQVDMVVEQVKRVAMDTFRELYKYQWPAAEVGGLQAELLRLKHLVEIQIMDPEPEAKQSPSMVTQ